MVMPHAVKATKFFFNSDWFVRRLTSLMSLIINKDGNEINKLKIFTNNG